MLRQIWAVHQRQLGSGDLISICRLLDLTYSPIYLLRIIVQALIASHPWQVMPARWDAELFNWDLKLGLSTVLRTILTNSCLIRVYGRHPGVSYVCAPVNSVCVLNILSPLHTDALCTIGTIFQWIPSWSVLMYQSSSYSQLLKQ